MENDASQQTQASEDMDQQIAESGGDSGRPAAQPDEKRGRQCHQLPEQKKGQEVPGENRPERGPCVRQRCHVLRVIVHVERIDHADERHQREDV